MHLEKLRKEQQLNEECSSLITMHSMIVNKTYHMSSTQMVPIKSFLSFNSNSFLTFFVREGNGAIHFINGKTIQYRLLQILKYMMVSQFLHNLMPKVHQNHSTKQNVDQTLMGSKSVYSQDQIRVIFKESVSNHDKFLQCRKKRSINNQSKACFQDEWKINGAHSKGPFI